MFEHNYTENEVNNMSPLIWAYIGDSVFEIYIREKMIEKGIPSNTKLHIETIKYVKAKSQSDMLHMLEDFLDEEELRIAKRARNTCANSAPKNADIIDYRNATALEGIIGYLYLLQKKDRLIEILNYIYDNFNIDNKNI